MLRGFCEIGGSIEEKDVKKRGKMSASNMILRKALGFILGRFKGLLLVKYVGLLVGAIADSLRPDL